MKKLVVLLLVLISLVAALVVLAADSSYSFTTYDNGMNGIWADDYFTDVQVIIDDLGSGPPYRVTLDMHGYFVTHNALSPGGDGSTMVEAGIRGTIDAREVILVWGTPVDPLPSNVGPIDYRPLIDGGGHPEYLAPYFSSITRKTYLEWEFHYNPPCNGHWDDTPETEALYAAVGPNDRMGDISGENVPCGSCDLVGLHVQPDTNMIPVEGFDYFTWFINGDPVGDENGPFHTPPDHKPVRDENGNLVPYQAIGHVTLGECVQNYDSEGALAGLEVFMHSGGNVIPVYGWFGAGDATPVYRGPVH